ncbi:hypothetical protein GQ53DRAFT_462458 [Thozetella sp. PMI_491]|nr:hypothetical protein GQ53DRAFT_462458 [Thozetella sp. PMI_491]
MHQQSRHPPRTASPASNPQTNPSRTNNPRDPLGVPARTRTGSEAMAAQDGGPTAADAGDGPSPGAGLETASGPSRETVKKLDQIIQNFHYKAAVVIIQSRINANASGARRSEPKKANKWFQLDTDDIDDFRDELRVWKTSGSFENRPPPMIIETYLDASQLAHGQSLVVVDDNGKRWDVLEALNTSESSIDGSNRSQRRTTEIVLERWRVELRCIPNDSNDDFAPILPTIYKRAIVFFRSLFTATRALPAWRYAQQVQTKGVHPALAVKCRFYTTEPEYSPLDPDLLRHPLFDGREAVTDYMFGDLEVPVGRLSASVTYRNDVNFRVDDSESLLSSRFMGVDEHLFRPSIPAPQRREHGRRDSYAEAGSVPSGPYSRAAPGPQQTYGSLSTFHGEGALATSPLTALKAVRAVGSDTSSPPGSVPASVEPDPPHSLPIRGHSRQSIRSIDGMARRPSVSFQPFKAGSLSASPRPGDESPASPHSRPATLSGLTHARNRSSLTAEMAALRGTPPPAAAGPTDIPPVVGSPKPTSRYSSSFTHRRGRLSFGGQSKAGDDDAGSSGNRSLSSSAQPGSGLLAEAGGGGSSGSFQTDDDISEFLKVLDSKKTLSSFEPTKKGESSTAKRTNIQLSRFQLMRDSNNALTESMTSSMQLQRSSSSSSRQLHNVPGMVNPASMSVSSSPGKPLSPHTPHTPAIPSRLSENSIIDYQAPGRRPRPEVLATEEEEDEPPVSQQGTTPMDIPLSPRLLHTSGNRRSSSVAQQHRLSGTGAAEDDSDLVQRSVSLGADDREAPTLSTLLGLQGANDSVSPTSGLQPAADIRPTSSSAERDEKGTSPGGGLAPPYRLRYGSSTRGGVGRATPPQSSKGSFSGARYTGMMNRAGEEVADEEPLVFAMSELERDSRRSLEEGRGGSASGMGSGQGRAFEPRGTTKRGW